MESQRRVGGHLTVEEPILAWEGWGAGGRDHIHMQCGRCSDGVITSVRVSQRAMALELGFEGRDRLCCAANDECAQGVVIRDERLADTVASQDIRTLGYVAGEEGWARLG